MMEVSELIIQIKEASIEVYHELGAGYDESIYEEAVGIEFRNRKIPYEVERNTEIFYKGIKVGIHRLDFILEDKLVVELKAQMTITKSHEGQTRAYLKTLNLNHGIIVNFAYPEQQEPNFKEISL